MFIKKEDDFKLSSTSGYEYYPKPRKQERVASPVPFGRLDLSADGNHGYGFSLSSLGDFFGISSRGVHHLSILTHNECTHIMCNMNVTLSIDEQTVARARKKAEALGTSLNQLIRDYLQTLAGGDDPEKSIQEFKRLSGQGDPRGWGFNRDEIHERS
jgi:hypothetical protein